ncbi:MAG: hypothetical protein H8E27_07835 [Verrucomicrobia subdivision 3 bacterium]|nr:hypothetical protein [Limisphaerales bacterium]
MNAEDLARIKENLEYYRGSLNRCHKIIEESGDNPLGTVTSSMQDEYRAIAVYQGVVEGEWNLFPEFMASSVECWLNLLAKYSNEGTVCCSMVDVIPAYKCSLDALAAGNEALSKQVANEIQQRCDYLSHRFSCYFAFAVKSVTLESDDVSERLEALDIECKTKDGVYFQGHAQVLRCIAEHNEAPLSEAFKLLLKGHRKLSRGAGMFNLTVDVYLSVWGLGLANLCHFRGLTVEIDDPLIPKQLLLQT